MRVDYNKLSNPKTNNNSCHATSTYPTEDGKALLAIDPDQPTRILSTDKKAQKAGGLCLALKGVPVKPTDDVDVDKEYQLIPIDSL